MDKKYYCVDRVENDIAVAYGEDGGRVELIPDVGLFYAGDMIYFDGECFVKDDELTLRRRQRLRALKDKLTDER